MCSVAIAHHAVLRCALKAALGMEIVRRVVERWGRRRRTSQTATGRAHSPATCVVVHIACGSRSRATIGIYSDAINLLLLYSTEHRIHQTRAHAVVLLAYRKPLGTRARRSKLQVRDVTRKVKKPGS